MFSAHSILLCYGLGPADHARELILKGSLTRSDGSLVGTRELVSPGELLLDGRPLGSPPEARLILMYKPKAHLCARHDKREGRPALGQYMDEEWSDCRHIGRLDYNTTGLLLWTNVPGLQRAVLDPQRDVTKVYHVKVRGRWSDDDPRLAKLASGTIVLDGEPVRPCKIRWLALRTRATWVEITLTEGRHRQVRRMCQAVGWQIVKLERYQIGPIHLPSSLKPRMARRADHATADALLRYICGQSWPLGSSTLDIQAIVTQSTAPEDALR